MKVPRGYLFAKAKAHENRQTAGHQRFSVILDIKCTNSQNSVVKKASEDYNTALRFSPKAAFRNEKIDKI